MSRKEKNLCGSEVQVPAVGYYDGRVRATVQGSSISWFLSHCYIYVLILLYMFPQAAI